MLDYAALPDQRQTFILNKLTQEGAVYSTALAMLLNVSEHTVRRDLNELVKLGLCKRVHGGAVRLLSPEEDFSSRTSQTSDEKRAIASMAASQLREGACVFLDAGSTNLEVARHLPLRKHIQVVTNSPLIATEAEKHSHCEVIQIGGKVNKNIGGCLGITAQQQLIHFNFDQTVLGVCAFDLLQGATAFDYDDAEFKRVLVKQSGQIIIPLLSEKISAVARYRVVSSDDINTIIVPASVSSDMITPWQRQIEVIQARDPDGK